MTHLKWLFRSLGKRKMFTLLNTTGLAVGIAAGLLLFILIRHELSIDTFHSKRDRIYRVVSTETYRDGRIDYDGCSPLPMSDALRREFPQAEKVAAMYRDRRYQFAIGDQLFSAPLVYFAEPEIFEIFDFPWLAGDPKTALKEPYTAAISQSIAEKWFGNWQNAIGKVVLEGNERKPYRITGVLENPPGNTDISLNVVLSYATLRTWWTSSFNDPLKWDNFILSSQCYFLLGKHQKIENMEAQLPAFVARHYTPLFANSNTRDSSYFQSLKDIHFNTTFDRYGDTGWSYGELSAMSLIGLFLLMVACINFVNLSTVQSITRAKEVGVRKALGSNRRQLFAHFMKETALLVGMAVIAGVILAAFALPQIREWLNKPVTMQILSPATILFIIILGLVITLMAGVYPALILSRLNPMKIMKQAGGISLRRGLIITQFIIAQLLIIGTLVVSRQMKFFKDQPMGFDKDAIVLLELPWKQDGYHYLKSQVQQLPGIQSVTLCDAPPAVLRPGGSYITFENNIHPESFEITYRNVDTDYVKTFRLQLKEGNFPRNANEVILNETAVKVLGFKNPADIIGKRLRLGDTSYPLIPVVGVLKDYHNAPLKDKIVPMLMTSKPGNLFKMAVKMDLAQLPVLEQLFHEQLPSRLFEPTFIDETVSRFYSTEILVNRLFHLFTLVAIFISCMGMYGLVSFLVVQKTREVGIRKVLGASVQQIVQLFLQEFMWLSVLAFLVAAPLGYYYMAYWLTGYQYHISIGWDIFLYAILLSVLVVIVSVGHKAITAGLANPVKSLRTE
ncbi:FtsX-like permease family protein [Chitinophaga sancti]|uniref:FtsX-like permease family protein n=1 Tax=Chitinophaga sancti TaxID=1004 RepID=UPI003F79DFDA